MRNILFWAAVWVLTGLVSCKPQHPKGILDAEKMSEILYDYHVAKAMSNRSADSSAYKLRFYTDAVFRKHGVAEAEFDTAMRYYAKEADKLHEIYRKVNERFAQSNSAAAATMSFNGYASAGDTMSVWQDSPSWLLVSTGMNRREFALVCDTTCRTGDKFIWQFQTQWMYKEGMKSAVAGLSIRYENDSIASTNRSFYGSGQQELSLVVGKQKPVMITGFVYQNADWSKQPKLLALYDLKLVKFRSKNMPAENLKVQLPGDTLRLDAEKSPRLDTTRANEKLRRSHLPTPRREQMQQRATPTLPKANRP